MKRLGIACCVLLLAAQFGRAQPPKIYAHSCKFGCGRITTIEKLTPVKNPDAPKVGDAGDDRPMVALKVADWQEGRQFTDETGRRWCLVDGCPAAERPAAMKGWIMQGDSGDFFFLDESGALFRRCGTKVAAKATDRLLIDPFGE
jgi:hypothetical protein